MQRLSYQLKTYIKAVEQIAQEKGRSVLNEHKKGSGVRFELFEPGATIPTCFWIVHPEHGRKAIVWSKEDYKKAAVRLSVTVEYMIEVMEALK